MGITRVTVTHPHSIGRVTYRYLAGRPLDGRPRTDARFFAAGTRALTRTGHASRWAFMPGWKRAAYRIGAPAVAIASTAAELAHPLITEAGGSAGLVAGATYGTRRVVRAVRVREHTRHYVRPLAAVLAAQLGMPDNTPAGSLVSVPLNFRDPDYRRDNPDAKPGDLPNGTVRVNLPAALPDVPDIQRAITRSVAAKLGLDLADLDARFHMVGAEPYATFRRAPRPPKKVTFADIRDALDTSETGAPVLGIGTREKIIRIDLDSDAPHLALSMGSGAGKSVLVRAIISQFLHDGAQIIIADGKRISQSWCKDMAGVSYYRTGEKMHHALLALRAEVDRRNDQLDSVTAEEEDAISATFQRIVFFFEEQNVGVPMLVSYWNNTRGKGDPKRSPALDALDFVLCTGRQVKTHVVSIAQMFTVAAAGGNPAARENYGLRGLGRATRNAWLMLAPEAGPPYPRSSRTRGRIHVVLAGEATECQCVFMTVKEARAWATSGAPVTVPVDWSAETTPDLADDAGQREPGTPLPPPPRRYTLADAAREPWCSLTYEAVKKARQRAPHWPEGVTRAGRERWTEAELRAALGLDVDQVDETAGTGPATADASA